MAIGSDDTERDLNWPYNKHTNCPGNHELFSVKLVLTISLEL